MTNAVRLPVRVDPAEAEVDADAAALDPVAGDTLATVRDFLLSGAGTTDPVFHRLRSVRRENGPRRRPVSGRVVLAGDGGS